MWKGMPSKGQLLTSIPVWIGLVLGIAGSLQGKERVADDISPAGRLALRRAIEDISTSFPGRYPKGNEFLNRLDLVTDSASFRGLQREALLANPHYPEYFCAHPGNPFGRAPLDIARLHKLEALGIDLSKQKNADQVSFDRPEKSPCLQGLGDPCDSRYQEALAIIKDGQTELATHPEADSAGFISCPVDQEREKKYETRRLIEQRNRRGISTGKKEYDD